VYFASNNEQKRANCATLLLAYMVGLTFPEIRSRINFFHYLTKILVRQYTVEEAYGPFVGINPPFVTFRDAGFCINTFPITVLDNARALYKARILGHVNYQAFSITSYQNLQKLQNGDISWIIPGKFIAFSGPVTK
jgi:cell division cycle 14